jgi:hypothetical protein
MGAMHLRAARNGAIAAAVTALVGFALNALVSSGDSSSSAAPPPSPTTSPSPTCAPAARPLDRSAVRGVTGRFDDVWFGGPTRAWAVGSEGDVDTSTTPVLAAWDGSAWAPSNDADALGTSALLGVDGAGGSDVWAVGWSTQGFGRDTLAAHYDGTSWHASSPAPDGELSDVRVLASDDAWAVGSLGDPSVTDEHAVAVHWNGSTWSQITVPAGGGRSGLVSIAGTTDDLWAAGYHHQGPLLMHYDGTSWTQIELPKRTGPIGAVAVSGSTVWAAGDGVFRGDGSSVREIIGAPKGGSFADVAPVSASAAFVVGSILRGEQARSVAMAINGTTTQLLSLKAAGNDGLTSLARVRGETWAAGWRQTSRAAAPLVATLTACR